MKSQFIVILFALITMPLSALAKTGDIQGTVYQRSTGKSLVDADVRILETDQHQKTDENGVFQFTELPEGTYTFVVTHPAETTPTTVSVAISSGDTTEVKIHLGAAFTLETVVVEGKRLPPTVSRTEIRFDNTHIVSVVANYNFTPNFEIGAKWQYLSGTSEAPISSIVLIQDPVTRGLNPLLASADEQLSTELAPYHKLDLRVSYKWRLWGLRVGGFLDVLNVYNRKNEIRFIFEEATLDIQGQEVGIEREVFAAPNSLGSFILD